MERGRITVKNRKSTNEQVGREQQSYLSMSDEFVHLLIKLQSQNCYNHFRYLDFLGPYLELVEVKGQSLFVRMSQNVTFYYHFGTDITGELCDFKGTQLQRKI